MVHGAWCMVHGAWCIVCSLYFFGVGDAGLPLQNLGLGFAAIR
jgi:hypothetical protein